MCWKICRRHSNNRKKKLKHSKNIIKPIIIERVIYMETARKIFEIKMILFFIFIFICHINLVSAFDETIGVERVSRMAGCDTKEGCNTVDLGHAINSFGLDLYKLLPTNKDGNIFFSPFSISTALAMTYLGTAGKTAQEMEDTLKFDRCPNYHELFKNLLNDINRKNQPYTLKSANNLFPNMRLDDSYLKEVANYYLAQITQLDFSNAAYVTKYINEWVSNNTEEKIKDIIDPGIIGPLTRLVLVNAIYFKGDWKYTFDKRDTKPMPFYPADAKRYKVDMMFQTLNKTQDFIYFEDHTLNAQILELFYKGEDISMVIILPIIRRGLKTNITDLEAALNITTLNNIQSTLANYDFSKPRREVNVRIPKFLIDWKSDIEALLKQLGMQDLFSSGNFSKLCGCSLPVTDVIHQAFVEVNEEGTEAAAATVVFIAKSIGSGPVDFRADHPFLFLIRHRCSNIILFMGCVSKPNKAEKRISCLTEKPCLKLYNGEPAPKCCGCRFQFKDPSEKKSKPQSPMRVLKKLKKQGRDDCFEKCLNDDCRKKFGFK
ncbi:unnamed protein product [Owenia fusiformis]|uniref:Uncharacterized protein n=1 Tax=Owenia fusiformis TaxID=6347 RepID=A0A8J1T7R1_OWEFU|nr:unnamed protein product [Owenia fusiformis]